MLFKFDHLFIVNNIRNISNIPSTAAFRLFLLPGSIHRFEQPRVDDSVVDARNVLLQFELALEGAVAKVTLVHLRVLPVDALVRLQVGHHVVAGRETNREFIKLFQEDFSTISQLTFLCIY